MKVYVGRRQYLIESEILEDRPGCSKILGSRYESTQPKSYAHRYATVGEDDLGCDIYIDGDEEPAGTPFGNIMAVVDLSVQDVYEAVLALGMACGWSPVKEKAFKALRGIHIVEVYGSYTSGRIDHSLSINIYTPAEYEQACREHLERVKSDAAKVMAEAEGVINGIKEKVMGQVRCFAFKCEVESSPSVETI